MITHDRTRLIDALLPENRLRGFLGNRGASFFWENAVSFSFTAIIKSNHPKANPLPRTKAHIRGVFCARFRDISKWLDILKLFYQLYVLAIFILSNKNGIRKSLFFV